MVYGSSKTREEKIAKMQALVTEGLESGISTNSPAEMLKKARALASKRT